jgi:hypothetical protein
MMLKLTLLFFCLIFNSNALASNIIEEVDVDNLYMVRNIAVYNKSTTALKAKEEALKQGQKKALKTIFERANIKPEYTKYISDLVLVEMIESIQIKNEIMTKDSYSGTITVLFNKKFLNFHLKRLDIGVGNAVDDVFLYIPILSENGSYKLYDRENSWYKPAYDDFFSNSYDNIFIIDNFDLANTALLSEKMINQNDYSAYSTLLSKYTANVVVISIASYDRSTKSINVFYKEIDGDNIIEKKMTYGNKDNLSLNDFFEYVSIKFLQMLDKESKIRIARNKNDSKNLEKLLKDNSIEIYIVIQNLKEYNYLKDLILNLPFVKRHEIVEFTTKLARLKIYYAEDESEIILMFDQKGFDLKNKNGKYFISYRGLK